MLVHALPLVLAAQPAVALTDAASKPENEFHYLGLLWNCAFQAGIASMGAHSKSASPPSITATPISAHSETPTSFPVVTVNPTPPTIQSTPTCDVSALQLSTWKPFGSLHRHFRRCLQVSTPVSISVREPLPLSHSLSPSAPVSPQLSYPPPNPPLPSPLVPHYHFHPPAVTPVSHFPPNEHPSKLLGSFTHRPSWFSLKPKIPHWIRSPSSLHSSRA